MFSMNIWGLSSTQDEITTNRVTNTSDDSMTESEKIRYRVGKVTMSRCMYQLNLLAPRNKVNSYITHLR